jgi:hypothetical protein
VAFGETGLIRGVAFGETGLIRGVAFGETGLIRGRTTVSHFATSLGYYQ